MGEWGSGRSQSREYDILRGVKSGEYLESIWRVANLEAVDPYVHCRGDGANVEKDAQLGGVPRHLDDATVGARRIVVGSRALALVCNPRRLVLEDVVHVGIYGEAVSRELLRERERREREKREREKGGTRERAVRHHEQLVAPPHCWRRLRTVGGASALLAAPPHWRGHTTHTHMAARHNWAAKRARRRRKRREEEERAHPVGRHVNVAPSGVVEVVGCVGGGVRSLTRPCGPMEVPAAVERDESAASLALAAERERLALCSEEGGVRLFFAEAEAARVLPLAPRLRLLVPARPLRELHRPSPLPRLTPRRHFGR